MLVANSGHALGLGSNFPRLSQLVSTTSVASCVVAFSVPPRGE
jgi:hypothetical protein